MTNHKNRIQKIEAERAKKAKAPIQFEVTLVDESDITPAMKAEQQAAHARGDRYYIIEPSSDGY